ncbi:MAG: serine/threonine-protein kinase [Nannocystaceae bacterium]
MLDSVVTRVVADDDTATRVVGGEAPARDSASSSAETPYSGEAAPGFASEVLPVLLRARLDSGAETHLGRYLLLRVLGAGGMGVVFSAYDDELDRKVAIKVLGGRADDGTTGRARIRREAQALARLSHPNIVQIYEVAEEEGQIYLVMELIDGANLREWTALERRRWGDVVACWSDAGRGLAAAHRAGLIHRDFKPDNAIVGRDGRVRVVDFGLARSGEGRDGGASTASQVFGGGTSHSCDDTTLTVVGTLLGTPAYMSPEQHLREPVDARADVFSFAVSLYEGLYAERPFAGRGKELAAAILRGELREAPEGSDVPHWVRRAVVRGLDPDPERRWQTMEEFLAALADDPAIRRRRVAKFAGVAIAAALVGGLARSAAEEPPPDPCADAGASIDAVWSDERKAAIAASLRATGLAHADATWSNAQAKIDRYVDGWRVASLGACEDTYVRYQQSDELLDRRLDCLREREREVAALARSLEEGGAEAVENAVTAAEALTPLARCDADVLVLDRVAPPPDDVTAAEVESIREALARIKATADAGRPREVLDAAARAVSDAEALDYPPILAAAQLRHAHLLHKLGDDDGCERAFLAAWYAALAGDDDETALAAAAYLPRVLAPRPERHDEAAIWLATAEALSRRRGVTTRDRLLRLDGLARLAKLGGRYTEAAALLEEALALAEAEFGASSAEVSEVHEAIAHALRLLGDYPAAAVHVDLALASVRERHGDAHPKVAVVLQSQALLLTRLGDHDGAEAATREALRLTEQAYGADSPRLAFMLNDLGVSACELGRFAEGEAHYRRAIDLRVAALGREHMLVTTALYNLGSCLMRQEERRAEAAALFRETLEIRERLVGPDHPKVAFPLIGLGDVAAVEERYDDAEALYRRALSVREVSLGPDHPRVAFPLVALAELAVRRGTPQAGVELAERALALRERSTDEAAELANVRFVAAQTFMTVDGRRDEAIALARLARETVDPSRVELIAELDAWLAEHDSDATARGDAARERPGDAKVGAADVENAARARTRASPTSDRDEKDDSSAAARDDANANAQTPRGAGDSSSAAARDDDANANAQAPRGAGDSAVNAP